jgi:hypothetical protein
VKAGFRVLTDIIPGSTFTTSMEEAFSSPMVLYDTDDFRIGNNSLSLEEMMLSEEYEKRQRPDLARCVRNGRKYHRLFEVLGHPMEITKINASTRAFLGEDFLPMPETLAQWKEWYRGRGETQ